MLKTYNITVDLKYSPSNQEPTLVLGDNGNVFILSVVDESIPVNLTGATVQLSFQGVEGSVSQQDETNGLTITNAAGGIITVAVNSGSYASSIDGRVQCELKITSSDKTVTTGRFGFHTRLPLDSEGAIASGSEFPILQRLIAENVVAQAAMEAATEDAATATDAANEAAAATESAIATANTATANTNTAASSATATNAAIQAAEALRVTAENARDAFVYGIEAEAINRPPGYGATAEVISSGESAIIRLGIPAGADGADAVNVAVNGMFYMRVDSNGHLKVGVADGASQPPLLINGSGHLIYSI